MIKYNKEYITRRNYMDLKEMQRVLDKNKEVDLIGLLNKTSNGIDGIGGVNTKGVLRKGYPK